MQALRMTTEAARRLARGRRTGRVHSAFARTINLELDGLGNDRWLSLHGAGPLPSPFGIACEPPPVVIGLVGGTVRVEPDRLVIGEALRVRLGGAVYRNTTLATRAPAPMRSRSLLRALSAGREGLLPTVAALLARRPFPATPLARLAGGVLEELLTATAGRDAAAALGAARPLLGLGPGLTPSGDDCLVGWLAGVWSGMPDGRRWLSRVGPGLLAASADRTSALSHAFLAAAVSGEAAEPVCDFVRAPDDAHLGPLLALGETSGADLLAGYLLARTALEPAGAWPESAS